MIHTACRIVAIIIGLLVPLAVEIAGAQPRIRMLNNGNLILHDIPTIPTSLIKDLDRFQNTRSTRFQDWTADETGLYITTRFGNVDQLHRVDGAGLARRQLTFFTEPVASVRRQPNGELLSFTMDAGGSENSQLFILDPNSGQSRLISDGASRNDWTLWRRDGKAIVHRSTRRNAASNDLWLTEIDQPESSRMIVQANDGNWWWPGDWNNQGTKLLVEQRVSVVDSRIHLLDLKTGNIQRLRGSQANPSFNQVVGFDQDETGYYFITDEGGEFTQLAHHKLNEPGFNVLTEQIPWDVWHASLSKDRDRVAFTVNAGGTSEVYLMDPNSHQHRRVDGLPRVGVVDDLSFSPSGEQLALTINGPTTPGDSYVLKLAANRLDHGDLNRWTHSEIGGLDSSGFVEPELISYATFDEINGGPRTIPAFIYRPIKVNKPVPVIISIHGGPEGQYRPRFSNSIQLWIDRLGAAVIAPNVRGSLGYGKTYVSLDNGFKREDAVKDIGALLNWIATQPDLDKDRVIVMGRSYGGYMALASAVHFSDRLKGAINVVGISNFVTFLQNTQEYRQDFRRVEYGDEREPNMRSHLAKISPINHVKNIRVPMLVVQGQNDPRVPVSESEQIVHALRAQGNEVWYLHALNEGHGYKKKENKDVYQQVVMQFLKKHLGVESVID